MREACKRQIAIPTIMLCSLKGPWCKALHIHLHPAVGKNRVAYLCGIVHQERHSRRLICVSTILTDLEGSMFKTASMSSVTIFNQKSLMHNAAISEGALLNFCRAVVEESVQGRLY